MYAEHPPPSQDYMKEQHLSSVMHRRVLRFFDYLWARNKGADQRTLLSDMPYCMQAEVSLAITEFLLKTVSEAFSTSTDYIRTGYPYRNNYLVARLKQASLTRLWQGCSNLARTMDLKLFQACFKVVARWFIKVATRWFQPGY